MKTKRTSKSLRAEALEVKKQILSGKLTGKKLQSAKYKYGNLMYRARKIEKAFAKSISKDQGFLPDFLKQVDIVRMEELIADRIFQSMKSQGLVLKQVKATTKKKAS